VRIGHCVGAGDGLELTVGLGLGRIIHCFSQTLRQPPSAM